MWMEWMADLKTTTPCFSNFLAIPRNCGFCWVQKCNVQRANGRLPARETAITWFFFFRIRKHYNCFFSSTKTTIWDGVNSTRKSGNLLVQSDANKERFLMLGNSIFLPFFALPFCHYFCIQFLIVVQQLVWIDQIDRFFILILQYSLLLGYHHSNEGRPTLIAGLSCWNVSHLLLPKHIVKSRRATVYWYKLVWIGKRSHLWCIGGNIWCIWCDIWYTWCTWCVGGNIWCSWCIM